MYTEIFFRAEVDYKAYSVLCDLMQRPIPLLCGWGGWPDHEFFRTERFAHIASGESFYFPHANHAVDQAIHGMRETMYFVSFRANLKNYDDEIAKFFDWVKPHCKNAGNPEVPMFIGYSLYEEDAIPTLYYTSKDEK